MVIRVTALPTSLSHDDAPQSVTAGTATECFQGRAGGRMELLVTTRSMAANFFGIDRLCIALATRIGGQLVRLVTLAASLPISDRLFSPAFFSSVGGPIPTISLLLSPFTRGRGAFRTAVSREGMRRIESTLTTLKQTNAAPASATGLIPSVVSEMLRGAQGNCEFPNGQVLLRSFWLRNKAFLKNQNHTSR